LASTAEYRPWSAPQYNAAVPAVGIGPRGLCPGERQYTRLGEVYSKPADSKEELHAESRQSATECAKFSIDSGSEGSNSGAAQETSPSSPTRYSGLSSRGSSPYPS